MPPPHTRSVSYVACGTMHESGRGTWRRGPGWLPTFADQVNVRWLLGTKQGPISIAYPYIIINGKEVFNNLVGPATDISSNETDLSSLNVLVIPNFSFSGSAHDSLG